MGICSSRSEDRFNQTRDRNTQIIEVRSPVDTGRPPETVVTGTTRPLKPFSSFKWKSEEPLSHVGLLKKRDAFWDTEPQFGGRQEIWGALRLACEAETMELAQAVIDSTGITVPTGSLADGCYDELGNQYHIPPYCFSRPANLLPDEMTTIAPTLTVESEKSYGVSPTSPTSPLFTQPLTVIPDDIHTPTPDLGPQIRIKIRLSSGKDFQLQVGLHETIGSVKVKVIEQVNPASGPGISVVKYLAFFLGRKLEDHITVNEANIQEKSVLQFFETPNE